MHRPELIIVHAFFSINSLSREIQRGGGGWGRGKESQGEEQKIQSSWSEVSEQWSISLILM